MNMTFPWKNSRKPQKFKRPTQTKCLLAIVPNSIQPSDLYNLCFFILLFSLLLPHTKLFFTYTVELDNFEREWNSLIPFSVCRWILLSVSIYPFLISTEFHSFPTACGLKKRCPGCNFIPLLVSGPRWVVKCILESALWRKGWDNQREVQNK